jgi:hypothetical protein
MKRLLCALVAGLVSALLAVGASGESLVSCDQFRERLAEAEEVFAPLAPRFHFREVKGTDDENAYEIENVKGITGQLNCDRETGKLSSFEVDLDSSELDDGIRGYKGNSRFMASAFEVTLAYTNWPKRRVRDAVSKMFKDTQDEVEQAQMRGDKIVAGQGSFDINDHVDMTYTIGRGGVGYLLDAFASAKASKK